MPPKKEKPADLHIRTSPDIKKMLEEMSQQENRSQSNMIETLIIEKWGQLKK